MLVFSNVKKYEGQLKNNNKEGYGVLYLDGNIFKGEWKDNKKYGYGIVNYSNGNTIEGEWKDENITVFSIISDSRNQNGRNIYNLIM